MKKLLLICLLLPTLASSQITQSKDLVERAYKRYDNKDYVAAAVTYDSAFSNGVSNSNDYFNAACFWAMASDKKRAFKKLESSVSNGFYDTKSFLNEPALTLLRNDKRWASLWKKVQQNELYHKQTISPLIKELSVIKKEDQAIRRMILDSILVKYGKQSAEADSVHAIMNTIDAAHLLRIKVILDKFGWLGPEDLGGDGATTLFLVIQHSNLKVMEAYLPMLRQAVKQNKALPSYLATLTDRILVLKNKQQLYGTQFQHMDNKLEFYPIADAPNVNLRRRQAAMGTIEDYAASSGVTYPN